MKEVHHELLNWQFHFAEAGLANSQEIDHLTEQCQLFRAPTIIFNQNTCIIS